MDEMKKILIIIVGIAVGVKLITIIVGSGIIGKLFKVIGRLFGRIFNVGMDSDAIWNTIGLIRAIIIVFAVSYIVAMLITVAIITIQLKWTWGV